MEYIKYVPLSLFVLQFAKFLAFSGNWQDLGGFLVLGALVAFFEFKSEKKALAQLKHKIDVSDENIQKLFKQNQELKTYISGLKMNQTMLENKTANARRQVAF